MLRYRVQGFEAARGSNRRFPKVAHAVPADWCRAPAPSEWPRSLPAAAHKSKHKDAHRNAGIAASPSSPRQSLPARRTLGECSVKERDAIFYAKLLSRSTAMLAACQHRVGFVNENTGAMRLRDSK